MNRPIYKGDRIATHILSIPAWLISLFFVYADFSEFVEVKIKGNVSAYPFGCVNECIWYYKSANSYSAYCLISGFLFLAGLFLLTVGLIKKRLRLTAWGAMLVYFLFFAQLNSMQISL